MQFTRDVDVDAVEDFTRSRSADAVACDDERRRFEKRFLNKWNSQDQKRIDTYSSIASLEQNRAVQSKKIPDTNTRELQDSCRSYSTSVSVKILEYDCFEEPLPPPGTRCALVWNVISLSPLSSISVSPEDEAAARSSVIQALKDAIDNGEIGALFI